MNPLAQAIHDTALYRAQVSHEAAFWCLGFVVVFGVFSYWAVNRGPDDIFKFRRIQWAGIISGFVVVLGLIVVGMLFVDEHRQGIAAVRAEMTSREVLNAFAGKGAEIEQVSSGNQSGRVLLPDTRYVDVTFRLHAGEVGGRTIMGETAARTVALEPLKATLAAEGIAFSAPTSAIAENRP